MIDPNTALTVGIPTIAVLVGILVNNSRLTDLRIHMDSRFSDLKDSIKSEFETSSEGLKRVEDVS